MRMDILKKHSGGSVLKFRVQRMMLLMKRSKKVKLSLEIYTNYVEQIKINTHPEHARVSFANLSFLKSKI